MTLKSSVQMPDHNARRSDSVPRERDHTSVANGCRRAALQLAAAHAANAMPRSRSATTCCRKSTACGICCLQLRALWPQFRSSIRAAASRVEDIEQPIAATEGRRRQEGPDGRTRPRRQAPRQSRRASRPSAARPCDDRARRHQLPLLQGACACHRRGHSQRLDVIPAQFR